MSTETLSLAPALLSSVLRALLHDLDVSAVDAPSAEGTFVPLSEPTPDATSPSAKPLTTLGADPVDSDGFRPSDLGPDAENNPDLTDNLGKAAKALETAENMSTAKTAAIKAAISDPDGWEKILASKIQGKEILTTDGPRGKGFGAEKRIVAVDDAEIVYRKDVQYTVGDKTYTETVYIFEKCANLSVDAAPDAEVPPPAPVCPRDSVTSESSTAGIDFDGNGPEKPVHEYTAIRVTDIDDIDTEYIDTGKLGELDKRIQSLIDSKQLQIKEGKNHFLLFADKSCDGVDQVYCVTITKSDNAITYTVSDFLIKDGKTFSELTSEEQSEWMSKP